MNAECGSEHSLHPTVSLASTQHGRMPMDETGRWSPVPDQDFEIGGSGGDAPGNRAARW